jgi:hypothetical protein
MLMPDQVLVYGDCAINPDPTPRNWPRSPSRAPTAPRPSASTPKVAMISYSTGTSGAGDDVEKVRASDRTRPANAGRTWCSTARCSTTPPRCAMSAGRRRRTARWPGRPRCSSSPTSTPATPPTRRCSAAPTWSPSARCCKACASRSTTCRAARWSTTSCSPSR